MFERLLQLSEQLLLTAFLLPSEVQGSHQPPQKINRPKFGCWIPWTHGLRSFYTHAIRSLIDYSATSLLLLTPEEEYEDNFRSSTVDSTCKTSLRIQQLAAGRVAKTFSSHDMSSFITTLRHHVHSQTPTNPRHRWHSEIYHPMEALNLFTLYLTVPLFTTHPTKRPT